jgi:hypothetical protein
MVDMDGKASQWELRCSTIELCALAWEYYHHNDNTLLRLLSHPALDAKRDLLTRQRGNVDL